MRAFSLLRSPNIVEEKLDFRSGAVGRLVTPVITFKRWRTARLPRFPKPCASNATV
jgi:hypothetical protein